MLSAWRILVAAVTLLCVVEFSSTQSGGRVLASPALGEANHHSRFLVERGRRRGSGRKTAKLTISRKAASVRNAGTKPEGLFYLQNVGTGKYFMYDNDPQTIILSNNQKSVMRLSEYQMGTRVSPVESRSKCFAAQWGGSGYDWAVTMYACRNGGEVIDKDGGHPQAKQQWHFVAVDGTDDTYFIIPEDHLGDLPARAISTKVIRTYGGFLSTALEEQDNNDSKQMWRLIPANN